jgi:hypothetical protein
MAAARRAGGETDASRFFESAARRPPSSIPRKKLVRNTKTCRCCGKEKNREQFRRSSHNNDGLGSWCCDCHAERARRWRQENPEKVDAYNARRRAEYRRPTRKVNSEAS